MEQREAKRGCGQCWLANYLKSYGVCACVDLTLSRFCSERWSTLWLECLSDVLFVLVSFPHLPLPPQYREPPWGMLEECVCMEGSEMYGEGTESVLEKSWIESR